MKSKNNIQFSALLIFLIICGAIKSPIFATTIEKSKQSIVCLDLKSVANALDLFRAENYFYPDASEGLKALVINPDIKKYPNHRKYIREEPNDPWGISYYYLKTREGFEVFSFGRDGKSGGEDLDKDIFFPDCSKPKESWFDKVFR